jgi:hypothetical protein
VSRRPNTPAFTLVALGVLALARPALAQDDVEDVIVRGSQAQGFESRASVDEAPRTITDAASLLEPLVGVHVRRLGPDDGFATLSIRGSASNEVAFYLAGVPLPAAADPTVDLSTLPLWPGTRARVYRTFAPAALGPGSLGGTLSIEPPAASGPTRTDLWMAGGSFGALRMRAADVSDLGRGVRLATGFSASRTDGDFSYYDVAHNPPISDPREFVPRLNDDFAQASALASLVVPLGMGASRSGTMRATTLLQAREQGLAGTISVPTPLARLRTDRELATVDFAFPAERGVIGAQLWGVRQGTSFHDAASTLLQPSLQRTAIVSTGGNASYRVRAGRFGVAAKLDARAERYEPGDYAGPTPPTGATRSALGLGVDGTWRPSRKVAVDASARVDGWVDASDDPAIAATVDGRPTAHAGIDAQAGAFALAAHAGYTARPANFVERFGAPGGFVPSPDLVPESAFTVDGGARLRKRFGKLRLEAELDGFGELAQELITIAFVGARNLPKAENVGAAALAGVEAAAHARFLGADIRVSYTGLWTENESRPNHPQLAGRPPHDVVADVSYRFGPLRLRWGLDVLAGMTADDAGTIAVPARALQSIGLDLDVPRLRGVRVAIDVRNLFDVRTAEYAQPITGSTVAYPIGDAYEYPLPGRSVLLSLSWRPRELGEARDSQRP